jgi:hypothetical protein
MRDSQVARATQRPQKIKQHPSVSKVSSMWPKPYEPFRVLDRHNGPFIIEDVVQVENKWRCKCIHIQMWMVTMCYGEFNR